MFDRYFSNTACGTGANYILKFGESRHFYARAYFKPEVCGSYNWRFFFSNIADSTYDQGQDAYCGEIGGEFEILSACIADGGPIDGPEVACGALCSITSVTFDGLKCKKVTPDERFWSDEVPFCIPEGHYLVWEWELVGNGIPCTPDSQIPAFVNYGNGYEQDMFCPKPMLLGCDRKVKKRIAFMGDSITQGCGTEVNAYEQWAARIATMLQPEYAVWNLGLGWGRGADAATDGSWLYRGRQNDTVILTYGVNDILHGPYGVGRGSTAGEVIAVIETLIEKLQEAGVTVILSTVPPFEFTEAQYREWRAVNLAIPCIAAMHGCRVFDIESALDESAVLGNKYIYGAHPDGNGGLAAANKFYQTFHGENGWKL